MVGSHPDVDAWIEASQKLQPPRTLAVFVYIRDGEVYVGRGDCPLERREFLHGDLPVARELIVKAINDVIANLPAHAEGDDDNAIPA